jgi:hypothetical protein
MVQFLLLQMVVCSEMMCYERRDLPHLRTCECNQNSKESLEEAGIALVEGQCRAVNDAAAPINPDASVYPRGRHAVGALLQRRYTVHIRLKSILKRSLRLLKGGSDPARPMHLDPSTRPKEWIRAECTQVRCWKGVFLPTLMSNILRLVKVGLLVCKC